MERLEIIALGHAGVVLTLLNAIMSTEPALKAVSTVLLDQHAQNVCIFSRTFL